MKNFQCGQAMTEMLVASAFVVVPLFLIVPMVGKYIDIQQTAISAARYAAWQQTVTVSNDIISTDELSQRVFSEHDSLLTNSGNTDCASRKMWVYHNKSAIASDCELSAYGNSIEADTSENTLSFVDDVLTVIQGVSVLWTKEKFDVIDTSIKDSVFISVPILQSPQISALNKNQKQAVLETPSLAFNAQAQVYSSTWSTSELTKAEEKVAPLVPSKLLNKYLSGTIQTVLATLTLSPEVASPNLEFGITDLTVLPIDKYIVGDDIDNREYDSTHDYCEGPQEYCHE